VYRVKLPEFSGVITSKKIYFEESIVLRIQDALEKHNIYQKFLKNFRTTESQNGRGWKGHL